MRQPGSCSQATTIGDTVNSLGYRWRRWWFIKKYRWKARFVVRPAVWLRRVPVIAIAGSNGKTTTSHLVERMLRAAGYQVGMCTTKGVHHNGKQVAGGDFSGPRGVWRALFCPGLQVIVAETGRGGILRFGLGYNSCRVGVVTNVYPDHLGSEEIETIDQMAEVKATIPRRTDAGGAVVLNADDPRVAAMASRTQAQAIYFSIEGREKKFERGWFLRDGMVCWKDGRSEEVLMPVREVPVTLGGVQRHHVANVLAALGAMEGIRDRLPVSREAMVRALREYGRDPLVYPDRFTLTRYRGEYVLLAYGKNPDSYRLEIPVIRRLQAALGCRHLIAITTTYGDRTEEWHRDIAKQLAAACDGVFLFPPPSYYRRGMSKAELVRRQTVALPVDRLLGTEALSPAEMIARARSRFREPCLFWYAMSFYAKAFDEQEFLGEAKVLPIEFPEIGLPEVSDRVYKEPQQ